MPNPDSVIESIRESFIGASQVYTNGSCVTFYLILKSIWPGARPYWSEENRHMITKIGSYYYDINGRVEDIDGYVLDDRAFNSLPLAVAFPQPSEKRKRFANKKKLY